MYFGYPFLLAFLSIFAKHGVSRKDTEPYVTFLIAAYNEEKSIRKKLENTFALDYPRDKLEIIVASDGSTDKTDDTVEEFKDIGVILYRIKERAGKTEARNRAIKVAKGETVVFSDATTIYEQKAIRKMVRNFYDPKVGAVSGRYDYTGSRESFVGGASILFWRYENFIKARQSRLRTLTRMSGCINSFRREPYEPLPRDIIEDLVEPLKDDREGLQDSL